ncbi:hypothetical protein G6F32_014912 [Rhizopus arrhizus]|nr:hypothetical protein G6F32_014912 [Rhizopus arrhizus]
MIAIAIAWFLLGLLLLALGGDSIVKAVSGLAQRFGASPFTAGLLLLGVTTSLPELAVNQHRQPGLDPGPGGDRRTVAAARAPAAGAVVVAAGGRCAADPVRPRRPAGALGRRRAGRRLHRHAGRAAAPWPPRERRGAGGHRRVRAEPHQPAVERPARADCRIDPLLGRTPGGRCGG